MIVYDSKDKELNIPVGLGNLNRVSPDYNGGDCKGFYEEGYDDGFEEGKVDGIEEGYETGFREGKVEGLDEGYDRGYGEGKTVGVDVYVSTLPTLTINRNGIYNTVNKGVTVNVPPEVTIDLQKTGLKFGYSNSTTLLDVYVWDNLTNMDYMFYSCKNLTTIPAFNTEKVTSMVSMFFRCNNLTSVPLFNTSRVTNMKEMFYACTLITTIPQFDTNKVTDMTSMFYGCENLTTIPALDTSNVRDMSYMFGYCTSLTSLPEIDCSGLTYIIDPLKLVFGAGGTPILSLTDVGGWIGLKTSWDGAGGLTYLPNLTYQSCINILNGLYDFVGAGIVPNSYQGRLRVHQNFLDVVGDEISIGTNKGWTITA